MARGKGRQDIEALIAERAKYETWLAQMAEKAASMPAHVVEKVRADYGVRLEKVIASLGERADELREEVGSLAEAVASLQAELSAKVDARAEDELRAMVGEYDEDEWAKRASEHDAGIAAIDADRAARATEHERVCALLADAVRPSFEEEPVAEEPVAEDTPDASGNGAGVAEPVDDGGQSPDRATLPGINKRPSPFDELGFLRAVVGRATPHPSLDTIGLPNAAPAADAAPTDGPASGERLDAQRRSMSNFEAPAVPDISSRTSAAGGQAARHTGEPRTTTGSSDVARTLKCQECGWMNYPTEWYCEKCGGELAAF